MALNNSQLHALVLNNLPNNITQLISPEKLREVCDEIIDSYYNFITDQDKVGLSEYDPLRSYSTKTGVLYAGDLYQANVSGATTPGAFSPLEWDIIDSTSAITGNYIIKDEGIELDPGKKIVLLPFDNSLITLDTGFYEAQANITTVGLTEEYPVLGKGLLQVLKGSSNTNSLLTWTPFNYNGLTYIRNLSSDWTIIDLSANAQNAYINGVQKIGNEVQVGGGFDNITLTPNTAQSAFNINGAANFGSVGITVSSTTINGDVELIKNNNFIFVKDRGIAVLSDSYVEILNLQPSNIAEYQQNFFGTNLITADRNIPDFALVKRYVDNELTAAALGADFVNGLTASTISGVTTVGLGGTLETNVDIELSGNSFSLTGAETTLSIDSNGVFASKSNDSIDQKFRLDVNSASAGLVYSNSAQTSDFTSVKAKAGVVEVLGDFTQNGTNTTLTSNLIQLNSADIRLTTLSSGTSITGKQTVIRDNVNGSLSLIDIDDLIPDSSVIVSGSESIEIQATGNTNYDIILKDDIIVNNITVADNIYHKGDLDTSIQFENNSINLVAGSTTNIAQFGFGNQATFNPDFKDVSVDFNGSGGTSIAGTVAGEANFLFIGGSAGYSPVVNGAHLRMGQSQADHAQINFYTNLNTEVVSPNEGDIWYANKELTFFDGIKKTNLLEQLTAVTATQKVTFKSITSAISENEAGVIIVDTAGITLTLPPGPQTGFQYKIKDSTGNAFTSNIIINGGIHTIDGQPTKNINENYASLTFIFDGTNYIVI